MGYTEFSQLPAKEAAIWEAAHVGDDGKKRQVTRQFAGLSSTAWATAEEFLEEVTDRLARWRDGRYDIIEAAQIVADSNSQVNAVEFCKQMEKAAHDGELTIRKNGIPISATELENGRIWNTPIRQTDVNKWLQSIDAGLELTYPYAGDNAQPQAAPVEAAPGVEAPASKPKAKRRTWWDVTRPYIAETMQAGQYPNAKQLFNALEAKAGQSSPFDKGSGSTRGSLFVRELSKPLALKTLQNNWQKVLTEVAKK